MSPSWIRTIDFCPASSPSCHAPSPTASGPALYSQVIVDRGVARCWVRPERAIGSTEDVGEYLFVRNQFIQTSSIVIARDAARTTRFDPTLRKGQDLDFCLRLQHDGVRFRMLDAPQVIWTDVGEAGRTSHLGGHAAPLAWLEQSRGLLTRRAYLGYRATVLAYYMGRVAPARVAFDLARAWVLGGVPARVVARNALRAWVPRATYRRLVDGFVARRGVAQAANVSASTA